MFEFAKTENNNRQKVYEVLYHSKTGLTQQEISTRTDLTTASIGNILPELERENLIQNSGLGQSRGGRKPVIYAMNPDSFYMIGLSIGLEYSVLLIANLKGEITKKELIYFKSDENVYRILNKLVQQVKDMVGGASIEFKKIIGIGISSPGPVDSKNGVILNPPNLKNWRMVNICQFFERELKIPAFLEKDANAMALSELVYGVGRGLQNILFIKVDYGIGYGIVIDGAIYRGTSGVAGEAGTTLIQESEFGIMSPDAQASGRILVERAREKWGETTLLEEDLECGGELQLINLIKRYLKGDEDSKSLFLSSAKYLGVGLANKVNFLNPEMVVLGGRIADDVKDYSKWITDYTMPMILQQHATDVQILKSTFGDANEALGATTIVLQNMFSSPQLTNMTGTRG